MVGQGARERNFLAPPRQRKVCMVKAKRLEPESSRFDGGRQRREVATLFRGVWSSNQ
jgi:hypothetical protein